MNVRKQQQACARADDQLKNLFHEKIFYKIIFLCKLFYFHKNKRIVNKKTCIYD